MPTPSASVSPTRSARISHPYLTPVSPHAHISHVPADAIPTRSRFKQPDTISLVLILVLVLVLVFVLVLVLVLFAVVSIPSSCAMSAL